MALLNSRERKEVRTRFILNRPHVLLIRAGVPRGVGSSLKLGSRGGGLWGGVTSSHRAGSREALPHSRKKTSF